MADKKVSDLTALTQADGEDLLLIVSDPVGAPASRKISVSDFYGNVSVVTTHTANVAFEDHVTFSNAPTFTNDTLFVSVSANAIVSNNLIVNGNLTSNGNMTVKTVSIDSVTISGNTSVSGNTTFTANLNSTGTTTITDLTIVNNAFVVRNKYGNPTSANAANEGITAGSIFFSDDYLYIAIDENTLKRVQLDSFTV